MRRPRLYVQSMHTPKLCGVSYQRHALRLRRCGLLLDRGLVPWAQTLGLLVYHEGICFWVPVNSCSPKRTGGRAQKRMSTIDFWLPRRPAEFHLWYIIIHAKKGKRASFVRVVLLKNLKTTHWAHIRLQAPVVGARYISSFHRASKLGSILGCRPVMFTKKNSLRNVLFRNRPSRKNSRDSRPPQIGRGSTNSAGVSQTSRYAKMRRRVSQEAVRTRIRPKLGTPEQRWLVFSHRWLVFSPLI